MNTNLYIVVKTKLDLCFQMISLATVTKTEGGQSLGSI